MFYVNIGSVGRHPVWVPPYLKVVVQVQEPLLTIYSWDTD